MRTFYTLIVTLFILAVLAGLGVFGYNAYQYLQEKNAPRQPIPVIVATTTPVMTWEFPTPTVATSSWKLYTTDELGYQVSYPADLVVAESGQSTSFAFKKDGYFHWPLLDDAKITITATSTCPGLTGDSVSASSTFALNGMTFTRIESTGVGAGNIYREIAYETTGHDTCYEILLFDHGSNGAGFYVSDAALIKRYDDQHTIDYAKVTDIFNAMAASFKLRSQPEGVL
jgi:hypothetical protein